jgi:hypothetical protein
MYLQVASFCQAELSAKVYADSFANPVVLHAEITINVQPKLIQTDVVVARARELAEASKQSSIAAMGSSWSMPTVARSSNKRDELSRNPKKN